MIARRKVATNFDYGHNRKGGDAVFAPKVSATEEDEGYLICFVQDEAMGESECLIFDAQDVSRGPVASILVPYRVPYGFHAGRVANA